MSVPLRVLIVEDSEDDAEMLVLELRRHGYAPFARRVESAAEMAEALERESWDVVLSDYSLPRFDVPSALALLKERGPDLPFIIVSGTIGEDTAVSALKAGAHDFIVKGNHARLVPAIERELREAAGRQARREAELALQESERRFRALIENASDIIAILDPDRSIRYISPAVEQVLGYQPEVLIGKDLKRLVYPDDAATLAAITKQVLDRPGHPHPAELRFRHRNGTIRTISAIANNVLHESGVRGVIVNARDVTERKQNEERIERQLQRLAALRTIDTAITASLELNVTLNVLLDQVTAQLGVDAAAVLLLNLHGYTLEYSAGRGFRSNAITRTRLRPGEGLAGTAALERRLVQARDLAEVGGGFLRRALLAGEAFVSYVGAPLIVKGQVQGVLEIFHRSTLAPDAEWLEFLEALAGQAAIAIDNAALFHDLQRSNAELTLAYDTTLEGWSRALDLRDKETEGHTQRVTEMSVQLARLVGMSESELANVRRGALLHDIGKMGIPDNILLKPGPLTDEEWVIMRKHPVYAYELLSPIAFLRPALDIPYCHHEKWDGTGYPRGMKGEQIPLAARVFAVVDVWDALSSDRPYRPAWPQEKVLDHLRSLAGTHFDPTIVKIFLEMLDRQESGVVTLIER